MQTACQRHKILQACQQTYRSLKGTEGGGIILGRLQAADMHDLKVGAIALAHETARQSKQAVRQSRAGQVPSRWYHETYRAKVVCVLNFLLGWLQSSPRDDYVFPAGHALKAVHLNARVSRWQL